MSKSAIKSTLRQIRGSLGRYLAILAIVALGVGLFAGLKITPRMMRASAQDYYDRQSFYDLRLISTLGWDREALDELRAGDSQYDGVRAIEGSYSMDALASLGGTDAVVKVTSLPESVNTLYLLSGRLPEASDECAVDTGAYGKNALGSSFVLSESNSEDDLESFVYDEYKIVGIVRNPVYSTHDRGTSSLGNGNVQGCVYIPQDGLDTDIYTDIYVKYDSDGVIYSDDYKNLINEQTPLWEAACKTAALGRYNRVLADARTALADGRKELADKQAEAGEKLADARAELDEAKLTIEDGEKQLKEAQDKLAQSRKEIEDGERKLSAARAEVSTNEKALDAAEKQIDDAQGAAMGGMLTGGAGVGGTAAGGAVAGGTGAGGSSAGGAGAGGTGAGGTAADALGGGLGGLTGSAGSLLGGLTQMADAKAQLSAGRSQLETAKAEIAKQTAELMRGKKQLQEGEETIAQKTEELEDGRKQWQDGEDEYADALAEYNTQIADAKRQIDDGQRTLDELAMPDTYALGRDTNSGYVQFESNSMIVDGIANIFPVFFFLVAAMICMTTMSRMIEEERTQIGIMKALGYSNAVIMGKYLFYSGSSALIGSIGGYAVSIYFYPFVIWNAFGMMYEMGGTVYVGSLPMAVILTAVALICTMGVTFFTCRSELKTEPSELLRAKAPKLGKRVLLERVTFIWDRLKFLQKVSLRNVFRYKKRFIMMVLGICGCTALLVMGFGIGDSVIHVADEQYDSIQTYDIDIALKDGKAYGAASQGETEDILSEYGVPHTYVLESTVDAIGDVVKSTNLMVFEDEEAADEYFKLRDDDDTTVAYPADGEVVLSKKLADKLNVNIGDTVTLRDADMRELTVTVSGTCRNYVYNYAFVNAATYKRDVGSCLCKNILVRVPAEYSAHEIAAEAMRTDGVNNATVVSDTRDSVAGMMRAMRVIVFVIVLISALLAFIVLYNLGNINISERIREIATIKVLGFTKKETSRYVFRENTLLTGLGALVGLAAGKLLHIYIMAQVDIDMISWHVHILPASYVYSLLLTFAFTFIVNRFMSVKLDRISMTESLKAIE